MTEKTQSVKVTEEDDGSLKISQLKGHHGKTVTVLLESDDRLRDQLTGFKKFLQEYAVVGLAVGFIIGQQAQTVVKQLVSSFIDPWVSVLFGQSLTARTLTLHHGADPVKFPWGQFIFVLIEFFVVLLVIYALIKILKLDKYRKAPTPLTPPASGTTVVVPAASAADKAKKTSSKKS